MIRKFIWLLLMLPLISSCQTTSSIGGKTYTTKKSYSLVGNQLIQTPEDSASFVVRKKLVKLEPASTHEGRTVYTYVSKGVDGIFITRLCVVIKKDERWRIKSL
jgi:hypothetical protein